MIVLLIMGAVLSGGYGWFAWSVSESAFQETVTFLSFLICAVFISAAGIVSAIEQVKKLLEEKLGTIEEGKKMPLDEDQGE
jgi:hypothetical protein